MKYEVFAKAMRMFVVKARDVRLRRRHKDDVKPYCFGEATEDSTSRDQEKDLKETERQSMWDEESEDEGTGGRERGEEVGDGEEEEHAAEDAQRGGRAENEASIFLPSRYGDTVPARSRPQRARTLPMRLKDYDVSR